MPSTYAIYKGDRLIDVGTPDELAKRMGIRPVSIQYLATPSYHKKHKAGIKRGTCRFAERIEPEKKSLCDVCKREHRDAWQDPEAVYCIRQGGAWMGKKPQGKEDNPRGACRWFVKDGRRQEG